MGKRKQNSNTAVTETETGQLDVIETEKSLDIQKTNCLHVVKAVDLTHIKKPLKSENLNSLSCTICTKVGVAPSKEENWVCLQCGARQCSKEHLKKHFEVLRSDLHALAFSIADCTIWCDLCSCVIQEEESKKLKNCVDLIKQMMERTKQVQIVETSYNDDIPPPLVEFSESNDAECAKPNIANKKINSHRPSVRGLVNLGNTCFFNSVLQCLARTPKLVETLRRLESDKEHISITLKNGQRLEGELEKSGDWLGQCLADTLVALSRPGETSSENPLKLLQLLRKKCPQFEGYDQHDSHELLRHLLDNVRQNDLKRYRSLMLSELGLSRKVNPQDVSPELQKKVKALDNEVVERVTLVPEHVFKGLLVSTLKCQECRNTSTCVESFLDLSLPIMADKPQPPSIRRKGSASPELVDEKVGGGMSKYQMKKQAKQARKLERQKARNKHGQKSAVIAAADGSLPASLDSHSDKGESEADVEDNEEDKPHESGYSSEKIQSESSSLSGGDDSARTSPTTHVKEEHMSNNSKIIVCEGLPTVGGCGGPQPTSLIPQPQYTPFPRVRRRPPSRWIGVGGSLTPAWSPHNDPIFIPDPVQVMDGGEGWKSYAPRNGVSPVSGKSKKDSRLNPILEESDRLKPTESMTLTETSVSDQVSLMSKVVETMLAQVHICQEDLDRFENKSVTESRDTVDNGIKCDKGDSANIRLCDRQDCSMSLAAGDNNSENCTTTEGVSSRVPRFNPFNSIDSKENSPVDDKINQDIPVDSHSDMNDVNQDCLNISPETNILNHTFNFKDVQTDTIPLEENTGNITNTNNRSGQEQNSPDSVTDETSNGFHIDSAYDRIKNQSNQRKPVVENCEDNQKEKTESEKDEDKEELLDITPILDLDSFKEDDNKKTDKKEDSENGVRVVVGRYRRKIVEKEVMSRSQDLESECSVQSCLTQFTAVEIMSGANRVGCSACTQRHNKGNKEGKTVYTIASKQLLIKGAPQVLILHLKRFQVQMYSFRKLSKHVSFPLYLDLAPFCLQEVERDENGKIMYSLYGVVEHSGNLNGGHYVAYIKVEDGENSSRWFCISDSYVHEVTENRVLQSQAYLLFYKRINDDSALSS